MKSANFYISITIMTLITCLAIAGQVVDWKSCQNKELENSTIPFNKEGVFKSECAPEVIYSWRPEEHLKDTIEKQKKGIGPVEGHPKKKLFLSKSPLSSHAYGYAAIRVKLKKDVHFVYANKQKSEYDWNGPIRDCEYYKQKYPEKYNNLVIVATLSYLGNFSEYILCDDGAIESWSYGTPEHLIEAEKEYEYYKTHSEIGQHENIVPSRNLIIPEDKQGYSFDCVDGKNCTQEAFDARMATHKKLAEENIGEIFYMPGTSQERSAHFNNLKEFYYSLTDSDKEKLKSPKEEPKTVSEQEPLPENPEPTAGAQ